jgi:glucokinase
MKPNRDNSSAPRAAKRVRKHAKPRLYLGVDVGGTKILCALAEESGRAVARHREATPRGAKSGAILKTIRRAMEKALAEGDARVSDLVAIGIAVLGVVDTEEGRIAVTPQHGSFGGPIARKMKAWFSVSGIVVKDVNLGTLGEPWIDTDREASSAFGIFVGTGIGGGFVQGGQLWRGRRQRFRDSGPAVCWRRRSVGRSFRWPSNRQA